MTPRTGFMDGHKAIQPLEFSILPGIVAAGGGGPTGNILSRVPTSADDTTKGYVVGDLWYNQTSGALYKATSVGSGAAVWAAQSPSLPLDTLAPAGTGGWSVRNKIRAAYASNACRIQRLSDSTFVDIGFDGNGVTDKAAALAFIASGASTYRVVTVYDQSGNGFDATQAVFANAPIITAAEINRQGGLYLEFSSTAWLDLPAGFTVTEAQDHTGFVIWRTKRSTQNDALYQCGTTATSSLPMARGAGAYYQGSLGSAGLARQVEFDRRMIGSFTSRKTGPAERRTRLGNIIGSASATFGGTSSVTGGQWGKNAYQTLAGVSFNDTLILLPRSATVAEETDMMTALHKLAAISPQFYEQAVWDGDSITQGIGVTVEYLNSRPAVYRASTTRVPRVFNTGITGNTIVQRQTAYSATNGTLTIKTTGKRNVLYIFAGTNDIAAGATGATTFTNYKAYVQTAITDGWSGVIVATALSRTDNTAPENVELADFNARILAENWGAISANISVIDLAAIDGTITKGDGIHPNDAGVITIDVVEKPVVDARLA